jgi:uncharacterized protein
MIIVAVLAIRFVAERRHINVPVIAPEAGESDIRLIDNPRTAAEKIVNGAKMEAMRHVHHDGSYVGIAYPNGDVPKDQGACTDVIVRALRNAGYDLQKLMHEDMERSFAAYPRYGLAHPDPNIDHRRVPNQMAFFRRHGKTLPKETTGAALAAWKPGDFVYWKYVERLDHCGVISNDVGPRGLPLVIHNLGICRQADCLDAWPIIGHYRYPSTRR